MSESCSICLESMISDTITTKCDHTFHNKCLKMVTNNKCPLCRSSLIKRDFVIFNNHHFTRPNFPQGELLDERIGAVRASEIMHNIAKARETINDMSSVSVIRISAPAFMAAYPYHYTPYKN